MKLASAFVVLIALICPSQASFLKGDQVHASCKPEASSHAKSMLTGYVMGVHDDAQSLSPAQRGYCVPDGSTGQQLVEATCAYLGRHDDKRRHPASYLVGLALTEAWPCPAR